MTHDLDDAIRASLRRNAESAPTVVDLDGVRDRATALGRRRVLDASLAVAATVIVALGIGVLVHGISSNQTLPPPVGSPTATSGPGTLPWIAYTNFDANAQPSGATRIQLRINGTDRTVRAVPGSSLVTVLGWYGADHRTLVWGEGQTPSFAQLLSTVTVSADGTTLSPVAPLRLPGQALTPGRAFVGADGALRLWMPDTIGSSTSPGSVVTINSNLDGASAPWRVGPGGAAFATAAAIGRVTGDGQLFVSRSPSDPVGTLVPVCGSLRAVSVSPDAGVVAVGCSNAHAELIDLASLTGTRIPDIPEVTDPGFLLGLWWSPDGHLHATTNPGTATALTTDAWTLSGGAWAVSTTPGVVTRFFTTGSPTVRLERLPTDGVAADNSGRLIVETDPPVDLGPAGSSVAVRPTTSPTPAPSDTVASPLGWTATVRAQAGGPFTAVVAHINGENVVVSGGPSGIDPAAVDANYREVVGWYGADGRTLVWQSRPMSSPAGPSAASLVAVTFAADGTISEPAHPLTLSGPAGAFTGGETGYAFPLRDQNFAVVTYVRASTRQQVLYVDKLFRVTSRRDVGAGTPVFVTSTAVGMQTGPSILVVASAASSATQSLASCAVGWSVSVSDDEQLATFSCDQNGIEQVDLEKLLSQPTLAMTPWPGPSDGDPIVSTWFSLDGRTHAATITPSGIVRTWALHDDQDPIWHPDGRQGVRLQVFTASGLGVDFLSDSAAAGGNPSGRWSATSDPVDDLGTATLDAGIPGGTPLAVRPQT
jgi:hypothetical protein